MRRTTTTPPPAERYVTAADVADRLRIGLQTVHNYVKAGKLPRPFKIGKLRLWERPVIEAAIRTLTGGADHAE